METEQTIYDDFAKHGLTMINAIERLEKIGYSPAEAEDQVSEWADSLEASDHDPQL